MESSETLLSIELWQDLARCQAQGVDAFYPKTALQEAEVARIVCIGMGCPVIKQCLEHALSFPEEYGVWGGKTSSERQVILRARERAASC